MNSNAYLKHPEKRGIALVLVLGMLSILIVLGVAFSISMRTERLATRSYLNMVKARHLTQTALYRVLGESIENEMGGRMYPFQDAFYAPRSMRDLTLLGDFTKTNSPAIFIPASVTNNLSQLNKDGFDWQELRSPVDNRFLGEFGYLVVNCSGLLDANVIGEFETNTVSRKLGYDPGEIRFSPYMLPEASARTLHEYRAAFRRFESVPELYYLTSLKGDSLGDPPLRNDHMADNLHVFSRYPRGAANSDLTANTNVAYVGGDPKNWDIPAIRSALTDNAMGSLEPNPIPSVDHFISVLYDYANEEYELHGATEEAKFERISSKRVPMINEVIVSNQFALADNAPNGHILTHRVYVVVETWYPFPQSGPEQFTVHYGKAPGAVPSVVVSVPPYPELNKPYTIVPDPIVAFTPTPNSYQLSTFVFESNPQPVNDVGGFPLPIGGSIPFRVEVRIADDLVVRYATPSMPIASMPIVDLVRPTWPQGFLLNQNITLVEGERKGTGVQAVSVNDPRINWDPSRLEQWDTVAATPKARNEARISGPNPDELEWMYSRRDWLQSVGEVGYLLYSSEKPWQTVRLLNPDPDNTARILDRLTVHTNEVRRGLVNVNSQQALALATAMWALPLDRYPNEVGASTLVRDDAITLAAALTNGTHLAPMANISEFKNKVGAAVINDIFSDKLKASGNKFLKESVLRNSTGVLGTRQNLFTVFVAARVYSDAYDPSNNSHQTNRVSYIAAEQRAVAVIWRDPLETIDSDGNKTHKSMIQYYHWLTGVFESD